MKTTIKKDSAIKETFEIRETFTPCAIKSLDSKSRISLGDKLIKVYSKMMKIDAYRICVADNGDVLLKPYINVPADEAWVYQNPKILNEFKKGLEDAKAGRVTKVKNLGKFLNTL